MPVIKKFQKFFCLRFVFSSNTAHLSEFLLVDHPEAFLSIVLSLDCSVRERCVDTVDKNTYWFCLQNGLCHYWEEHHRRLCLTAEWPELLTVSLLVTKIFWEKLAPSCSRLAQQPKIQAPHWAVTLMCLDHSKMKLLPSRRMQLYCTLHFLQPIVLVVSPVQLVHGNLVDFNAQFSVFAKGITWEKCFCLLASVTLGALKLHFQMPWAPPCPEMFVSGKGLA